MVVLNRGKYRSKRVPRANVVMRKIQLSVQSFCQIPQMISQYQLKFIPIQLKNAYHKGIRFQSSHHPWITSRLLCVTTISKNYARAPKNFFTFANKPFRSSPIGVNGTDSPKIRRAMLR